MISYYSAVFLTALLMLGLLMYGVRKRSNNLKPLVLKVVGLTTVIALLLPTLLNNLTMIQTGLLMALLAALAGALVPVAELLPDRAIAAEEEPTGALKAATEPDMKDQPETKAKPGLASEKELVMETGIAVEKGETFKIEPEEFIEVKETFDYLTEEAIEIEPDEELEIKEELEIEEEIMIEEEIEVQTDEEIFTPGLAATAREDVGEGERKIALPDTFSETMAEVMLMNGYLALKDEKEEEAIESFSMVCQRALVTDQRMMAYMELKRLMPEVGKTATLIQLGESLIADKVDFLPMQTAYIKKHTHYLKRLASLLNAQGVTLEQPYSAMPDELKEMAMTYQE